MKGKCQVNRMIQGCYELERDDFSDFFWSSKEVVVSEKVYKEQHVLFEVPDFFQSIDCMIGNREITLSPGFYHFPENESSLRFSRYFSPDGDERKLCSKIRLFPRTFYQKDVFFNIYYVLKKVDQLGSEKLITVIETNAKDRYVDFSVITNPAKSVKVKNGCRESVINFSKPMASVSLHFQGGEDSSLNTVEIEQFVAISKVSVRNDWFDFHNLESNSNLTNEISSSILKSKDIKRFVQWYVTWKCNYSCHYCWQEANQDFYRTTPRTKGKPEDWAKAFNELEPDILYLTGGEPTLYKYLPEMLSSIHRKTKFVMTTNLGMDLNIDKFIKLVSPDQFIELMVSYHPTQVDQKVFEERIEKLHAAGFDTLGIEMVLNPSNLDQVSFVNTLVSKFNLEVRYDDFHSANGLFVPSKDQKKVIDEAKTFSSKHNEYLFSKNLSDKSLFGQTIDFNRDEEVRTHDISQALRNKDYVYCGAGMSKITVDVYGDVYACTSAIDRSRLFGFELLPHYGILGNILNKSFSWNNRPFLCNEAFRCSACDYQVLEAGWIRVSNIEKMIIPE